MQKNFCRNLSKMPEARRRGCAPEVFNSPQKLIHPILLVENGKNVPEYAEILCKSVQIFQKGRKSSTLCILRKLWKVIVRFPMPATRPKGASP